MGLYRGDSTVYPEQVYQFEQTDLVVADVDNVPLQNLADRTEWLRARISEVNNLTETVRLTGSATIDSTMVNKYIQVYAGVSTIVTLTLKDLSTFPDGAIIRVGAGCGYQGVTILRCEGSTAFNVPDMLRAYIYMHNNEFVTLAKDGPTNSWRVIFASDSIFAAGEELKGRRVLNNTLALNGTQINLSYYPRLKEYISSLTYGREVVDLSTWLSSTNYRGLFGLGTGSASGLCNLPDERGMFERMLDGGRGVDLYRSWNFAGGYEADALAYHTHTTEKMSRRGYPKDSGDRTDKYYYINEIKDASYASSLTVSTAGNANETIVKNIGKLNLIRY